MILRPSSRGSFYSRLFLKFPPLSHRAKGYPERAGNENRRIAAAPKTHQEGKGEVLRGIATEPVQGEGGEQDGTNGVDGARQRLIYAAVCQFGHIAATPKMEF